MADAVKTAPAPAPTVGTRPRPSEEINADLAARRARFLELEAQVRDLNARREQRLERRRKLEQAWAKENNGMPFDPESYNPPATVPEADTPTHREFHKSHYAIAKLEAELTAAKKAETGD